MSKHIALTGMNKTKARNVETGEECEQYMEAITARLEKRRDEIEKKEKDIVYLEGIYGILNERRNNLRAQDASVEPEEWFQREKRGWRQDRAFSVVQEVAEDKATVLEIAPQGDHTYEVGGAYGPSGIALLNIETGSTQILPGIQTSEQFSIRSRIYHIAAKDHKDTEAFLWQWQRSNKLEVTLAHPRVTEVYGRMKDNWERVKGFCDREATLVWYENEWHLLFKCSH